MILSADYLVTRAWLAGARSVIRGGSRRAMTGRCQDQDEAPGADQPCQIRHPGQHGDGGTEGGQRLDQCSRPGRGGGRATKIPGSHSDPAARWRPGGKPAWASRRSSPCGTAPDAGDRRRRDPGDRRAAGDDALRQRDCLPRLRRLRGGGGLPPASPHAARTGRGCRGAGGLHPGATLPGRARRWNCWGRKAGKAFFFEKKKQKTFAPCRVLTGWHPTGSKSFLVLFFKNDCLPCLSFQARNPSRDSPAN